MRTVILLCGPPGAGKTTLARNSGLTVYDMDDPEWNGSEAAFRVAITDIGYDDEAQAVVIRAGATQAARTATAALIAATEIKVIDTPLDECIRRIRQRARLKQPHPSPDSRCTPMVGDL
jgi:predicted kinase